MPAALLAPPLTSPAMTHPTPQQKAAKNLEFFIKVHGTAGPPQTLRCMAPLLPRHFVSTPQKGCTIALTPKCAKTAPVGKNAPVKPHSTPFVRSPAAFQAPETGTKKVVKKLKFCVKVHGTERAGKPERDAAAAAFAEFIGKRQTLCSRSPFPGTSFQKRTTP